MKRMHTITILALLAAAPSFAGDRFEEPPISYTASTPENPVAAFREALRADPGLLKYEEGFGYLRSVLTALKVPIESQVLVFSKTSLQQRRIAPTTPRALYFNDDIYVGSVPAGDVVEISTADPKLGAVFYSLTQHPDDHAEVIRQVDNCLQCHGSTLTGGYPGHIMRSVFTDVFGYPILSAGSYQTTENSLFSERWGGWYVTGTHGAMRHMGNAIAEETQVAYEPKLDREEGANQLAIHRRVDLSRYLAPQSDIVALMVLAHQIHAHNLLTQTAFETAYALRDQAVLDELLKTPAGELSDSTKRRIDSVVAKLVDCFLFLHEPRLEASVKGTSGFAEYFAGLTPKDTQGRSLRELDLQTRLFKYPLSYLIYSSQFDDLPDAAKARVYKGLWDVLADEGPAAKPAHLDPPTRQAIREIVAATKTGLPDYWK